MIEYKLEKIYPNAKKWEDKPVVIIADCDLIAEECSQDPEIVAMILANRFVWLFGCKVRWNIQGLNQGHYAEG